MIQFCISFVSFVCLLSDGMFQEKIWDVCFEDIDDSLAGK